MGNGFICAGLFAAALLSTGCLQGADDVELDEDSEASVLAEAEDALGINVRLRAKHSERCLDIEGASWGDGTPLLQWDCTGLSNQRFHFVKVGKGTYVIVAAHSGDCLEVTGASTQNGVPVIQWPCHGEDNQRFRIKSGGGGHVAFVASHSEKCLEVEEDSNDNGARIIQHACHSGDNQRFQGY